jgi:probable phosphoglycerate mutase
MREAQARAVAHVERVAAAHPGATVALISHSDVVKAIVAHALSLPLGSLLRFDIDPASVSRLAVGDWGMRVMGLNERVGE